MIDMQTPLQFNQSNLQDFLDCPRRFELNVLNKTAWPAATANPMTALENSIHQGNRFHQLCQQYFTGIAVSQIQNTINDPVLLEMWEAFLPFASSLKDYQLVFEQLLHIPFNTHRLVAKYDLVVKMPDHFLILDWKTSTKKPPLPTIKDRVQTYLYPYILAMAGTEIFPSADIDPNNIKMCYWYPLADDPEIIFDYSDLEHNRVRSTIEEIIAQIQDFRKNAEPFPLTDNKSKCEYCSFRSLCDRGSHPGDFVLFVNSNEDDLIDYQVDFEQISELEF